MDWNDGPLAIRERWSAWSESGVVGDATLASAEKGRIWLEQAVREIGQYIDEVGRRPLGRGRDHHNGASRRLSSAGKAPSPMSKGEDR